MAGVLQEFCGKRGLSFVDGELVLAGGSFQASQSAILTVQHNEKSNIRISRFRGRQQLFDKLVELAGG